MRLKPKDIPNHPWFKEISFDNVFQGKVKSPYVPKIKGLEDYSNFDKEFLDENCVSPQKKISEVEDLLHQNNGKYIWMK